MRLLADNRRPFRSGSQPRPPGSSRRLCLRLVVVLLINAGAFFAKAESSLDPSVVPPPPPTSRLTDENLSHGDDPAEILPSPPPPPSPPSSPHVGSTPVHPLASFRPTLWTRLSAIQQQQQHYSSSSLPWRETVEIAALLRGGRQRRPRFSVQLGRKHDVVSDSRPVPASLSVNEIVAEISMETATSLGAEDGPVIENVVIEKEDVLKEEKNDNNEITDSVPSTMAAVVTPTDDSDNQENDTDENSLDQEQPEVVFLTRLLFSSYYASLGILLPYLPVFFNSIGHGGRIIGLLGAVKPFTTFLVAPLWGIIADQSSNPHRILQLTFVVSCVGQMLVGIGYDQVVYLCSMIFLTALFNAPVKSLLDAMVLRQLVNRNSYGRLRLWGQLGFGMGSSMAGFLLSQSKASATATIQGGGLLSSLRRAWKALVGYKLLFFLHGVLSLPAWLCVQAFYRMECRQRVGQSAIKESSENETKSNAPIQSGGHVMRGIRLISHNTDVLIFFSLVLAVGISSGMVENFAYVRMREVGGTGKAMGLSRLLSSLAGAPMFWYSGALVNALGVDRVLVLALTSYSMRFFIYATMKNAYYGLPAEILRGMTFAAFWSSATMYAHRVAPEGLHATMLLLTNAMYGGLGQSLGAVLGGRVVERMGIARAFLCAAGVDASLVVGLLIYLHLRKSPSNFANPQPIQERVVEIPSSSWQSSPKMVEDAPTSLALAETLLTGDGSVSSTSSERSMHEGDTSVYLSSEEQEPFDEQQKQEGQVLVSAQDEPLLTAPDGLKDTSAESVSSFPARVDSWPTGVKIEKTSE